MEEFPITQILLVLLSQAPVVLLCLAALVVSFVNQARLGKAFPFSLLGFGIICAVHLVFPVIHIVVPRMFSPGSVRGYTEILGILNFAQGVLQAIGLACLGAAIFTGREARKAN